MRASRVLAALLACAVASVAARDAAAATTVIRVLRDVAYVPGNGEVAHEHQLDLYLPEGRRNVPVLVVYHGGGLMLGDKAEAAAIGLRFAAAGFVTAIPNYRLSPAVTHPAHVEDAAAALAWVKRNVGRSGGNPDQLFVVGHSAGAYLAALLATDERYLAAHDLALRDIRGVVPISAFYWVGEGGVAPDRDKRVWGTEPALWADASPGYHVRQDAPAMLVLYARHDEEWRRKQNVAMAQALRDAGDTQVEIAEIPDRTHETIWSKLAEPNDETAERIIQFVRAHTTARRSAKEPQRSRTRRHG